MEKVNDRSIGALSSKTINNSDDHGGGQHSSSASISSTVRNSTSPLDGALSRVISSSHHASSTLPVSNKSSSMALSISDLQNKNATSAIVTQSCGIPGPGNTILFSPRQLPTFSSSVIVDRPAKRRRLASPPSHGLIFNFGLAFEASRNDTYESSRNIALERPNIAQAAQIEISELSEEAKAITGYTTEKSIINEQVLSTSRSRLYKDKALAPRTGESTNDGKNAITSPDLSAGSEAVTELKNKSVSGFLLSEESQVRAASVAGSKRRFRNKEYVVAKEGPSTGGQYLQGSADFAIREAKRILENSTNSRGCC
ncbi:hypothetical protein D6D06_10389 [Aureobasidium pullulans]|nr:hypothetical protein D6D06_10389 [Aureobasidium pullulans]